MRELSKSAQKAFDKAQTKADRPFRPKSDFPLMSASTFIVTPSGKVLMLLRSHQKPTNPDRWGLPGGKLERGETPRQGGSREAGEETGMALPPLTPLYYNKDKNKKYGYFICVVEEEFEPNLEWEEGRAYQEHTDYCWIPLDLIFKRGKIQKRTHKMIEDIGTDHILEMAQKIAERYPLRAATPLPPQAELTAMQQEQKEAATLEADAA